MKPIVKIGGVLIAIAMLLMVFVNPSSCGTSVKNGNRKGLTKKQCAIRALRGVVQSGIPIEYEMRSNNSLQAVDSLVTMDGRTATEGAVSTTDLPLGRHTLTGRYIYTDSSSCESSWSVEIISDIEPGLEDFNLVSVHDHDPNSFTQGLIYHEGRIYEGTGQHGESHIRNYDVKSLDYSGRVDLEMTLFGEGITILNDKLYQLTYKARKGIVYDVHSMEEIQRFDLPTIEGWGLTDDGSSLIMSDGTNVLTYLDPVTFEVVRTQQVYNNERKEVGLNELEYVDGFIYANIYGASFIAKIDASSGKVLSYIDCRGILAPELQESGQDVFNGIAYNPDRQTFYLTGKYWPKLFEVRFIPRMSS